MRTFEVLRTSVFRGIAAVLFATAVGCGGADGQLPTAQSGANAASKGTGAGSQQACEVLSSAPGGANAAVGCKWTQTWATPGAFASTATTLPYFPSIASQSTGIVLPGVAVSPPIVPPAGTTNSAARFVNATIRQNVKVSIGGTKIRLRLSNAFTPSDLKIDDLHVALWDSASCPNPLAPVAPAVVSRGPACSNIVPGTDAPVTLGGNRTFVVPAGQEVYTDPVDLAVSPLGDVAVSMYFKDLTPAVTTHSLGISSAFRVVGLPGTNGNFAGATMFDAATLAGNAALAVSTSTVAVVGIDVLTPSETRAVVAFGDSITDGANTTPETNTRWSNYLAQRLVDAHKGNGKLPPAVSNAGISGNKVVTDNATASFGISAVRRFQRDVLSRSGITDVIVLEGINDIGQSTTYTETADNLIAAYRTLIQQAHAAGLKIYFATMTPIRTDVATAAGVYTGLFSQSQTLFAAREPVREAVNQWILTSREHDGAIDFNSEMSAPGLLNQLYAPYSVNLLNGSNDQLHPDSNGYGVMGGAVNLGWFE
jgi:lysophospholipase L1-like esterase